MKAIVIGGDSSIGAALAAALSERGDSVCCTTRRSTPANPHSIQLDLSFFNVDAVKLPQADIAFFCAAITRFAFCRENEELSRQVNVFAPISLASRLVAAGTRVVLLSTSAVFDWRSPHVPSQPAQSRHSLRKAEGGSGEGIFSIGGALPRYSA